MRDAVPPSLHPNSVTAKTVCSRCRSRSRSGDRYRYTHNNHHSTFMSCFFFVLFLFFSNLGKEAPRPLIVQDVTAPLAPKKTVEIATERENIDTRNGIAHALTPTGVRGRGVSLFMSSEPTDPPSVTASSSALILSRCP